MSLTIELRVNGRLIGGALVVNKSDLAEVSDYEVEAVETASRETGRKKDFRVKFPILDHKRKQTVWALVAKVAAEAQHARNLGNHDHEPRERNWG